MGFTYTTIKRKVRLYLYNMNLQENINRIKQVMGLITEDTVDPTQPKVINVSGYDLSKVVVPELPIGQYPISFYFKTDYRKQRTTAILKDGFVYFMLKDDLAQERIYKLDKTQFETSLKDKTNTPDSLEVIEGPIDPNDKSSREFKKLKELINQGNKNLPADAEPDITNVPKIDLTTTMQGKSYILDIWATFCGPCKKKIDEILTPLNNELASSGLTFFFYSVDSDVRRLKEFADDNLSYATHAFDNKVWDSEIFTLYKILSIPKTYFVDKEGNLYTLPQTLQEAKDLILKHL